MDSLAWLKRLKESFASTGLDYEDLYELIEASMARGGLIFQRLSMTLRGELASL